jgi:hypothetical protein
MRKRAFLAAMLALAGCAPTQTDLERNAQLRKIQQDNEADYRAVHECPSAWTMEQCHQKVAQQEAAIQQELRNPVPVTETACGDRAIQHAQMQFEMIGGGSYGQEQRAVRDAVANCPSGATIVMLRKFAGEHCDLSKSVVDTGYGRVACVKR